MTASYTLRLRETLSDWLAINAEDFVSANQVNYDRLLELGVIRPEEVAEHLSKQRRRDGGIEGRWTEAGKFYPSARENAGDIYSEPPPGKRPRVPKHDGHEYYDRCWTREHIAHLVSRCLRGEDVPPDVQQAVDCCGWDPRELVYRTEQAKRFAAELGTGFAAEAVFGRRAVQQAIGFEMGPLAAGETKTFTATPAVRYKIERLFISRSIASSIVVHDLVVGNISMLSIPVGADVFDTEDMSFAGPTVLPNQQIRLTVENVSRTNLTFTAGLMGMAMESPAPAPQPQPQPPSGFGLPPGTPDLLDPTRSWVSPPPPRLPDPLAPSPWIMPAPWSFPQKK